jgi:pyruvate formate lyase activating enzyme
MSGREQIRPGVVHGEWWHTDEDGRIACDLCPRDCRLREGQRGFCYVREAVGGEMVLTSYGRASGFCIDPIEKKPLNHFHPGTSVLSFGTAGCNLGCHFCQNWDISKARHDSALSDGASPEQIAAAAVRSGCRSIAFTYNDPVIFAEYAIDCAIAAHERGVATVAVTAGYVTEAARADFFRHVDATNVDLKGFTEDFYRKVCLAHLEPVLETLEWLVRETDTWVEVTTLLIPGHNDSEAEIDRLCAWFHEHLGPDVPLHFTAFHPDFRLRDAPPTPPETLSRARRQALSTGLRYVYTGNVHDPLGQSTVCPGCGEVVLERDWYSLGRFALDADGCCQACGTRIPGRFDPRPGTWGPRRVPLRLSAEA